jgi:hypothetical protein
LIWIIWRIVIAAAEIINLFRNGTAYSGQHKIVYIKLNVYILFRPHLASIAAKIALGN